MRDVGTLITQFWKARLCVLTDDLGPGRSVLVAPAQEMSELEINRIINLSGGLTFVALAPERAAAFMLPQMPHVTTIGTRRAAGDRVTFLSVEAREGVTTGISAADRATTIRLLGATSPQPRSLVKPGHIFPLETKSGGVLVNAALPEAALDLVTLAGFSDAALFVDLLNPQGELVSFDDSMEFARKHGLPLFGISTIIQHRLAHEPVVTRAAEAMLPTKDAGDLRAVIYRSTIHNVEHVALVKGQIDNTRPTLVRVQTENTITDVFGGGSIASRAQLRNSLRAVGEQGSGIVLYLRRASIDPPSNYTDSPLAHSTRTSPARMRDYGVGAHILRDLGVKEIELLSSTHRTLEGLSTFGIRVVGQRPIPSFAGDMEK